MLVASLLAVAMVAIAVARALPMSGASVQLNIKSIKTNTYGLPAPDGASQPA